MYVEKNQSQYAELIHNKHRTFLHLQAKFCVDFLSKPKYLPTILQNN